MSDCKPANGHREWEHKVRVGSDTFECMEDPRKKSIEPWLSALLQAEHLNLLVGSGLTTAIADCIGTRGVNMDQKNFNCEYETLVSSAAEQSAKANGRDQANIEDQIRVIRELIQGLAVLGEDENSDRFLRKGAKLKDIWHKSLEEALLGFFKEILDVERCIRNRLSCDDEKARKARRLLASFLLTFGSRATTRERLHVFTTNYDRLIEFGADLLGLRVIDRFVGGLEPVFRASRLGIDMHYNPPGIRGEPRYLEGVIRFSKLHGSIDWRQQQGKIFRASLPFGAAYDHSEIPKGLSDGVMIYPNPAKDIETLEYPYAELFRDFAGAICQPNTVLMTYGYGFGDDHINRILRDMLTIPSTHLAIISYDDAGGRVSRFYDDVGCEEQVSLLVGKHFGDLSTLVEHYLPKPAMDRTTWRMVDLLNKRLPPKAEDDTQLHSEGGF